MTCSRVGNLLGVRPMNVEFFQLRQIRQIDFPALGKVLHLIGFLLCSGLGQRLHDDFFDGCSNFCQVSIHEGHAELRAKLIDFP